MYSARVLKSPSRERIAKNRTHKEQNTDASSAQLLRKTLAQALLPPTIRVATTGKKQYTLNRYLAKEQRY